MSRTRRFRLGSTVIEQNNVTGRVSYWQASDNHSVADGRGVSLADYIHAMYGLIRQAKARRVLLIGCGGGTLATMLHRVGVAVTVVDIDPTAFEIARRYFHMPPDIECHLADGAAFLRRHAQRYDAVVLDAYAGGAIPGQFLEASFYALVRKRLKARGGLCLVNIIAANDDDPFPDRVARLMGTAWKSVRILDCDGYVDRNVVLAAGAVRALAPPRLTMRPQRCARSLARSLHEMAFRAPR